MSIRKKGPRTPITAARLKELLAYDPATGVFVWRVNRGELASKDSIAGGVGAHGYIAIEVDCRPHRAHRLAWLYVTGELPDGQIDHINGVRTDNRFANLREATPAENARNCKLPSTSKSGIKGVSKDPQSAKWCAHIHVNNRKINLGRFVRIEDAQSAYASASRKYHKDFGRIA